MAKNRSWDYYVCRFEKRRGAWAGASVRRGARFIPAKYNGGREYRFRAACAPLLIKSHIRTGAKRINSMGLTCDLLTATIVLGPLDVLFARVAGNSCVTLPARRKPVEYEENGAKIAGEPRPRAPRNAAATKGPADEFFN